jgi:hypothetical protein
MVGSNTMELLPYGDLPLAAELSLIFVQLSGHAT